MNKNLKPVVIALAGVFATFGAVQAADSVTAEKIEVVSQSPLHGFDLPKDKVPSNVQIATDKDLQKSQSLDLTEFMNRNLGSVHINETQSNPLQPDVNYRGFTASPLLGTPQGMSVYMDGVRMNQAFGDVISWDLIPKNAIKGMQLMPGSNPLFGLNTLGGAISITTKDGRNSPGGAVQATLGSYNRHMGEFEYGGVSQDNSVDYFVAGTAFEEDGWRDKSDSNYKQLFTKLGWQGEKTELKLTYAYADSDLNGNGLVQKSFLDKDRSSVNTYPDNTKNENHLLNLNWAHYFTDNATFSGNAYYRRINTKTFNGDLNDESLPAGLNNGLGVWTGTGWTEYGSGWKNYGQTINNSSLGGYANGNGYSPANNLALCQDEASSTATGEPGEKCTGILNRSRTTTDTYGIFGQFAVNNKLFDKPNTYTVGGGVETSDIKYKQTAEYGSVTLDRGVVGSGYFADQVTQGVIDGTLDDRSASLKGRTTTWSIYGTDTLSLRDNLHLMIGARYNHTKIKNRDRQTHYEWEWYDNGTPGTTNDDYLRNTGNIDEQASLDGTHKFNRINPSIGLSFNPTQTLNTYASYSESNRAPTSMELGCANENAPCKLPNSMAGDPPLKQVVAKTWEAGLRERVTDSIAWNLGLFSTTNYNDIQFIAANTSEGYFSNVGKTRRRGVETGVVGNFGALSIGGNYTYLDATYQSDMELNGVFNSSNDAGKIDVKKGDRIPLMPRNMLKLYADYQVTDKLQIGLNSNTVSSSYARGNENNDHDAANAYDQGKIAGYTVVNLSASYQIQPKWTVFGRVLNVFDREYETAALLGQNPFNAATGTYNLSTGTSGGNQVGRSTSTAETFVAPGAPRTGWVGVRYAF